MIELKTLVCLYCISDTLKHLAVLATGSSQPEINTYLETKYKSGINDFRSAMYISLNYFRAAIMSLEYYYLQFCSFKQNEVCVLGAYHYIPYSYDNFHRHVEPHCPEEYTIYEVGEPTHIKCYIYQEEFKFQRMYHSSLSACKL